MSAEPDEPLNGDMTARVAVDVSKLPWVASPSPGVDRKRLHRVGPAESGQVTSVVRYAPGSTFPPHEHPEGEEIFVLEGVFSDEHGDWPAGTYLLNPEGFRHAPFSREGCVIFVKLRQADGEGREHVALQMRALDWQRCEVVGVEEKVLYQQDGFPESVVLERWRAGAGPIERCHAGGVELFVIHGQLEDEVGLHGPGTWLRYPAGGRYCSSSLEGCTLFVKRGGVAKLWSGADGE